MKTYLTGIGDASSQWWGWVLRRTVSPNQSISGNAVDRHLAGRPRSRKIINAIFFWQDDHCLDAWLADEQRAQEETERKLALRAQHPEFFQDLD